MSKSLPLFAFFLLSVLHAFTQQSDTYYIDNRGKDALLAPRVGIGAGVFTYFGDVNDNNYQHIFTSTYGVEVLASANLSRYFDLDLSAIYGNITVNQRNSNAKNFNFKSELFIGSVGLSYNFNHLYKRPGIIQPFVGIGAAFINFDSKTDKYDAQGNEYFYWSQGEIMSLPEHATNSEQAVPLQRDYVYETDLRQQNADGLGKYEQFTFGIPVSAGIDFKMGRRVSAKLSASFYYTFTDLIDDISDKGTGIRKGNAQNDMFLFTSAAVSYSIGVGKTTIESAKTKYYQEHDFYALRLVDSDGDGVNDFDDECAQTPRGIKVDERGCPLDTDQDVIEDYRDDEAQTPFGNVVNLRGVTLTDEMMWEAYKDSTATVRAQMHQIYPSGVLVKKPPLTSEDSTKLALMMLDIQNSIEQESEYAALFEEMSKEVFDKGPEKATSVEQVFQSVDQVYKRLVSEKVISPTRPLTITKNENIGTAIPPEFTDADYNTDGIITASEVMRVIDEVLEGTSPLTISQLYNLIDFYNEYMEDAEVINFGGTMAIYINGTLNILNNYADDGLTDTERFLANKYKLADYNGDGKLTADEVNRIIALYQQGKSPYTESEILNLIDLFFTE